MKTYLTYGFALALGGALLTLVLYLLGYHSDAAKLATGDWISRIGMLTISIACIVMGTKARRAELPITEDFGYGRALWAGVMITLLAAVFSVATTYLYVRFVNPGFGDLITQVTIAKAEAGGASAAQIEQMEKGLHIGTSPIAMGVISFLITMFFGTLISLVTGAFLKRNANELPTIA